MDKEGTLILYEEDMVPHQVIIPDLKVASSSVMMTLETFPISSLAS